MVSFADVSVTDASAHRMLADYFAERAATFPASQGAYRTTFPDPGQFVPPKGVFLLAYDEDGEAGCGGIRELPVSIADAEEGQAVVRYEIKHLWVAPGHRRRGLGRAILAELEHRARGFGATEVVLDTNSSLEAAGALYRTHGYESIQPYNDNPNATDWFRKPLA
ncbi:GNAT family N-acetyltransferase [Leifsonia sp. F6_8S_P_1B]|uniref:GNAT family N-acetyltransferase n=1 Tax=Leifsonia williamsii TaxID=3035919 RepID=A0ABT8KG22_9MICO|nr:GNAT family N-acetyltransferase [Leifsonia williamsii]MDN4615721.1 GNAT family N-acetyltransferase [Leifsonia williamsii]